MSLGTFSINIGGSSSGGGVADGKSVRTTRFVSIGSSTSGTVTLPSNSTVVLDDFGGTVDAVVTTISGGKPTKNAALTALGAVVATTFDSSGNWVFTAAPSAYPVAIVYRVQQTLANFDSTSSDIWGEVDYTDPKVCSFGISIDGGGTAISTGVKGYLTIPFACTIQGWTMLGDVTGSIVVDVWKVAYASFPPTVANTIAGSQLPTISTAKTGQNLSLTTWTTLSVAAGDTLGFNVNSCTSTTKANLVIQAVR